MKNKKYVMMKGLAFSDTEELEMLHQEALRGWICRRVCFIVYILHREEPQNVIFDYDIQSVHKKDKDAYISLFEAAGWTLIPKWNSDAHFFYASEGTCLVHTDKAQRAYQYKRIFYTTMVFFLIGLGLLILTLMLRWGVWMAGIAGAFLGVGIMGGLGTFLRSKGKRLNLNSWIYSCINLAIGLFCVLVNYRVYRKGGWDAATCVVLLIGIGLCIDGIYGFIKLYKKRRNCR